MPEILISTFDKLRVLFAIFIPNMYPPQLGFSDLACRHSTITDLYCRHCSVLNMPLPLFVFWPLVPSASLIFCDVT